MATLSQALGALVKGLPNLIATWAYPWIYKPQIAQFVGGLPNAEFLNQKVVDAFTNPPATIPTDTTVPELAFALTMQQALIALTGIDLEITDMAPLMVRFGTLGLADPELKG